MLQHQYLFPLPQLIQFTLSILLSFLLGSQFICPLELHDMQVDAAVHLAAPPQRSRGVNGGGRGAGRGYREGGGGRSEETGCLAQENASLAQEIVGMTSLTEVECFFVARATTNTRPRTLQSATITMPCLSQRRSYWNNCNRLGLPKPSSP